MADRCIARSELVVGGQKSGKTAHAEAQAAAWLAAAPDHRAVYVATAQGWDDEMRERIARHRRERALRVPRMSTVEEPCALAQAIGTHGRADTLVVVDCLTLWLTALLMPPAGEVEETGPRATALLESAALLKSIVACPGPLLLVSNEIGLGVVPLGREVRAFVDVLGTLNQQVAAACERVTLMAAGVPLTLKDRR